MKFRRYNKAALAASLMVSMIIQSVPCAFAHGSFGHAHLPLGHVHPRYGHGYLPPPPPPPPPIPASPTVNVKDYGAKGDGATDDSGAIQQAIAAAQGMHEAVLFPAGNYLHNSTIFASGVGLMGVGAASVLTAGDNLNSAVVLEGTSPSMQNLVVSTANLTGGTLAGHLNMATLCVVGSNGFNIQSVTVVQGVNRYGLWIQQSVNGGVSSMQFNGTGNPADNGLVIDGCANVAAIGNLFNNEGTGIMVQGLSGTQSQTVNLTGNTVHSTSGPGISSYLATYVTIAQNQITSNNVGISLADNTKCIVSQNTISGGNVGLLAEVQGSAATGVISQNNIGNCQHSALLFSSLLATRANYMEVTNNQLGEAGLVSNGPNSAVISDIGPSPSGLNLVNNTYTGHANMLNYYIYSSVPIDTVFGNTQAQTVLPNSIP
jgi:parallel beta-helix repeat protein